jgi:hypothetical protein
LRGSLRASRRLAGIRPPGGLVLQRCQFLAVTPERVARVVKTHGLHEPHELSADAN